MTPILSADEIFAAALALSDPSVRLAYLDRACAGNPSLRQEVESLLAAAERAGTFLEAPATDAGEVLREAQQSAGVPLTEKPGDRIGRYKLLEQIGEGGFGVVWMAEQEEPVRRRVALKIIKLGMDTKEVVARFEAERQALAMMEHPNIASVFDGGAIGAPGSEISNLKSQISLGRSYFVMELVKGIPITDYCDANRLSTRERLELFMQICQAVQHAHQKGVIHRDLKPSNILVTVKDDRPVPKVIDFGIAKATQARLTEKTLFTRLNQWIGTPAYMSPEQAGLGSLDVDTRSDVYALGVLLYELLTGRPPFDTQKLLAAGYEAVMRTIREEEPPKPSTRLSTLTGEELSAVASQRGAEPSKLGALVRGDLDWIVMKALEKDRTRRYETANDFARDIERHLGSEPVSAAAPGLLYLASKFVRRNRPRLAFATLAIVAVALAVTVGKFGLYSLTEGQDFVAKGTNTVFAFARAGDTKSLTRLLDANPRLVHQRDSGGATPLDHAASAGSTNALRLLVACGALVDATNVTGLTPLGHADFVELLLAHGVRADTRDASGNTPLHMAVQSGNRTLVELLLAHGADIERRTSEGATALGAAVVMRAQELVQVLLAHDADPNAAALDGTTMLMVASQAGATNLMMALLDHGAETHAANQLGMTALLNATAGGSVDAVRLLLDRGAKSGDTDRHGNTLLLTAAKAGRVEMLKFLLELGASLADHDGERFTVLHGAVDHGHAEVVEFLLGRGLDVNSRSTNLYTPLHCAANAAFTNETQYVAVAGVLLAHGADANARTRESQTPLHRATDGGRRQILQVLLAAGADPNARDADGKTAWDLAKAFDDPGSRADVAARRKECAELLRKAASNFKPSQETQAPKP